MTWLLVPVVLGSELYGESAALLRRVSAAEVLVQTNDVVPLGAIVTVHFPIGDTDDEIVARAEVANVLELKTFPSTFVARGMRLTILDFDENLPLSLPGSRVLH